MYVKYHPAYEFELWNGSCGMLKYIHCCAVICLYLVLYTKYWHILIKKFSSFIHSINQRSYDIYKRRIDEDCVKVLMMSSQLQLLQLVEDAYQ